MWLVASLGSAFFAGITAILAKLGIRETDSDVATLIRTAVVLIFAWLVAALGGALSTLGTLTAYDLGFLALSGCATGASWLCYFKALSLGDINKVVPVDKCSTPLAILLATLMLQETDALFIKLVCSVGILVGALLMIERVPTGEKGASASHVTHASWFIYASLSAVFAALTSILAKLGMGHIDSNLAVAIRTGFVLIMAAIIVLMQHKAHLLGHTNRRELGFIVASGIATGASWLCYYYAIASGVVSVVVPVDKLSIVVSMVFSAIVFHETYSKKSLGGLALIVVSTVVLACAHA